MHKNPGKGLHTQVQARWVNRNRLQPKTSGEIQQMQARLEALLVEAGRKSLDLAGLMHMKALDTVHLKEQVNKAFKKDSESLAQKALVKANVELSNHLRHVDIELASRRIEIKKIHSAAQALATLLRKKFRTGPRASYPGK